MSALPYPRHTFNESTYRTYVSRNGAQGVYFFGRYLSTPLAVGAQRTLAKHTWLADFDVKIERSGRRYDYYSCQAESECGDTRFEVTALDEPEPKPPFESGYRLTQFITYRLHGFFTSSAGFEGHMPVAHRRMRPASGELHSGRFDLWDRLGFLFPDEVMSPYCVLVQPPIHFTLYPPRPA